MARLLDGKMSEGLDTLVKLAKHGDFTEELAREIRKEGGADRAMRALCKEFQIAERPKDPLRLVIVPTVPSTELVAHVNTELALTKLDPRLTAWDCYHDGRKVRRIEGQGTSYRVLLWTPNHGTSSDAVEEHFGRRGYFGHVGAFLAWLLQTRPTVGRFATVPPMEDCVNDTANPLIPIGDFDDTERELVLDLWGYDFPVKDEKKWTFVGFRPVIDR